MTFTVTSIEWMTKTRARIYINDEFAFILQLSELKTLNLSEGDELSEDVYEHILKDYVLKRAKLKAMELLNMKDYTEYELRMKLKKDLYPAALIDSAVDYVRSYHYIDDERYTRNYLAYHSQGQSRQMIRQKLQQKGIASQIIDQCMDETQIDEISLIENLLMSKYKNIDFRDRKTKEKAMSFLLRKGFQYSDIRSVFCKIDRNDLS